MTKFSSVFPDKKIAAPVIDWGEKPYANADNYLSRALFDPDYYLLTYPDIASAGLDPVEHYLQTGWREGRNPSRNFDTKYYLATNPDVRAAEECPLIHYATAGVLEGRLPAPPPERNILRWKVMQHFDADYYFNQYPDVAIAGLNPLMHYLETGWREDRNPSANFDTRYYLEAYPDVRAAGICPLVHFASKGAAERRITQRPPNAKRAQIDAITTLSERCKPWMQPVTEVPLDLQEIRASLEPAQLSTSAGIVLAVSHDDYITVVGGVQNCISDEEQAFRQAGWTYIHLCPARPLPVLTPEVSAAKFLAVLRVNSKRIGLVHISDIATVLSELRLERHPCHLVIHHFLGFSPEVIAEVASILKPDSTIVWLHDFFTVCSHYALQRNDVEFCFAPDVNSAVCHSCCFGAERASHFNRISSFFATVRPVVLAGSQTALSFWQERGGMSFSKALVVPLGRVIMDQEPIETNLSEPIRVGFLGFPIFHKGWHSFENLAARHYGDRRYTFHHLGQVRGELARNIQFVETAVSRPEPEAMIEAIVNLDLDVVVNWSLCYETFSYVTHEALAAGTFVVTRREAGNVWPAILRVGLDRGCALDTDDELFELFETGRIITMLTDKRYGRFERSGITASYLLEDHR